MKLHILHITIIIALGIMQTFKKSWTKFKMQNLEFLWLISQILQSASSYFFYDDLYHFSCLIQNNRDGNPP